MTIEHVQTGDPISAERANRIADAINALMDSGRDDARIAEIVIAGLLPDWLRLGRIVERTVDVVSPAADVQYRAQLVWNGSTTALLSPSLGRHVAPADWAVVLVHPCPLGSLCFVVRQPTAEGERQAALVVLNEYVARTECIPPGSPAGGPDGAPLGVGALLGRVLKK